MNEINKIDQHEKIYIKLKDIYRLLDEINLNEINTKYEGELSNDINHILIGFKNLLENIQADINSENFIEESKSLLIKTLNLIKKLYNDDSTLKNIGFRSAVDFKADKVYAIAISLLNDLNHDFNDDLNDDSYKQKINSDKKQQRYESTIEKQNKNINMLVDKINSLRNELDNLDNYAKEKIESVDLFYKDSKEKLQSDRDNIDILLGKVSESVIAGSFEKSAGDEKESADYLRIGSLVCMIIIACIVGYSLYETTTTEFKWQTSLFRLIFSILLSVPAAYLARESAKHRQLQHSHLETSLNLKAIGPYIASLPEEEQNLIKSDIAKKMFMPKSQTNVVDNSYPINTQEILLKLIDKFDTKSTSARDKN